jgi:hypothetical protein
MLGKTFITVMAAFSLLSPAVVFAQGGQQQGRQQMRGQSPQDEQTQQGRSHADQGQEQPAAITADVQVTPQGQLSEAERRALSLAAGRLPLPEPRIVPHPSAGRDLQLGGVTDPGRLIVGGATRQAVVPLEIHRLIKNPSL